MSMGLWWVLGKSNAKVFLPLPREGCEKHLAAKKIISKSTLAIDHFHAHFATA